MLPTVTATRYVTPLREGGSLPGLMEADDLGTYVVKFHGAGQGRKALVAEVIAGELGRALGLPVPRLATIEVDPMLATNEPDEEVQDLLRASAGLNLAVDFLPGALDLDVGAFPLDPLAAGRILWFDALIGNVDRSWRNPNMLFWHGKPYLIDHGAALSFHHRWSALPSGQRSYDRREHALLRCSPDIRAADSELAAVLTPALVRASVELAPESWLAGEPGFAGVDEVRAAYASELLARFAARASWLDAVQDAVAASTTASGNRNARPPRRPEWLAGPA